jgi:hypothetical protein
MRFVRPARLASKQPHLPFNELLLARRDGREETLPWIAPCGPPRWLQVNIEAQAVAKQYAHRAARFRVQQRACTAWQGTTSDRNAGRITGANLLCHGGKKMILPSAGVHRLVQYAPSIPQIMSTSAQSMCHIVLNGLPLVIMTLH